MLRVGPGLNDELGMRRVLVILLGLCFGLKMGGLAFLGLFRIGTSLILRFGVCFGLVRSLRISSILTVYF